MNTGSTSAGGWLVCVWTYFWPDGLPSVETPSVGSLGLYTMQGLRGRDGGLLFSGMRFFTVT